MVDPGNAAFKITREKMGPFGLSHMPGSSFSNLVQVYCIDFISELKLH